MAMALLIEVGIDGGHCSGEDPERGGHNVLHGEENRGNHNLDVILPRTKASKQPRQKGNMYQTW